MMLETTNIKPELSVVIKTMGHYSFIVNYNIVESSQEVADGELLYDVYSISLPLEASIPTEEDYPRIVSLLVRERYSADDVEAILNNYIAEKTAEHKAEWKELQSWRSQAKDIARRAIEYVNKNV